MQDPAEDGVCIFQGVERDLEVVAGRIPAVNQETTVGQRDTPVPSTTNITLILDREADSVR